MEDIAITECFYGNDYPKHRACFQHYISSYYKEEFGYRIRRKSLELQVSDLQHQLKEISAIKEELAHAKALIDQKQDHIQFLKRTATISSERNQLGCK